MRIELPPGADIKKPPLSRGPKPDIWLLAVGAYGTSHADLAVVDSDIVSAIGIAAHPSLELDGGAIASVIGQGQHVARVAPQTLWVFFHDVGPSAPTSLHVCSLALDGNQGVRRVLVPDSGFKNTIQ